MSSVSFQSAFKVFLLVVISVCGLCAACGNNMHDDGAKSYDGVKEALLSKPRSKQSYDGIDVSHHNGIIDWGKVAKDTNVRFVYIKATDGATWQDNRYASNLDKARKHKLKVGTYHYFRMTSSPKAQFANFQKTVPKDKQDLIPMIDVELYKNKKGYHMDKHYVKNAQQKKEIIDHLREFLSLVEKEYGCKPMLYCTSASYNHVIKWNFNGYKLYVGRYCKACSGPGVPDWTIWQYSEKGKIADRNKTCDVAIFSPSSSIKDITMPQPYQKTSINVSKH